MGNDLSIGSIYESTTELLKLARERAAELRTEATLNNAPSEPISKSSPNFGSKTNIQTANEKQSNNNDWTTAGAINTQNLTTDKASQGEGRDHLEAHKSSLLLDSQLDNKDNTFISFSKDGKQYLAFRSNDELRGSYYGFKEKGETQWRSFKDAPVEAEKLKQHLEKAHNEKQKTIEKLGGYENFKSLQTIQGEIADLNDLHRDSKGEPHKDLDASRQKGLKELETLETDIKAIKEQGTNNSLQPQKIQERYLAIKRNHAELATDLVMNRFTKASTLIGEEKLQASFNNMDTSLKALGAKQGIDGYDLSTIKAEDRIKAFTATELANQAISKEIDSARNSGQQLTSSEQAEKERIHKELNASLKTLETNQANNPEFKKLKQYYESISDDENKGKYALAQLKSLQGYLNSNPLDKQINKVTELKVSSGQELRKALNELAPETRIKISDHSTTAYFSKDAQGNIYQDDGNKIAKPIKLTNSGTQDINSDYRYQIQEQEGKIHLEKLNLTGVQGLYVIDQEGKEKTVIGKVLNNRGETSYQNIPAERLEQANIDAYALVDADGKKRYYSFIENSEKNKAWEVKLANDGYSKIQAGLTEDSYNGRKSYEKNGLKFFFEANGSFIGLMATPSRDRKLEFDTAEFQTAQRLARTKSFFFWE